MRANRAAKDSAEATPNHAKPKTAKGIPITCAYVLPSTASQLNHEFRLQDN